MLNRPTEKPFDWSDRPVCVTGGSGFLGRHLVALLRERGAQVRVFSLPPKQKSEPNNDQGVETVFGDLLDEVAVRRAVAACEVVFHLAGNVAVWGPGLKKMHAVHVEGTRRLLAACEQGTRIVHTSSVVAVGATTNGRILDENSPFELGDLRIDYVHAKRNAERVALSAAEAGQDVVVVNPAYLLGPEDLEPSVMGRFCVRFWRGLMPLAPPGGINLVDVRDAALGHLLAAEHGIAGRRYILGGENHSLASFMQLLTAPAGLRPRALPTVSGSVLDGVASLAELRAHWTKREPYPSRQHVRLNRYHWYYRSERAAIELGFRARPLTETIQETYDSFAARKPFQYRGFKRWWLRPAA